jgi:hypothetical protein
MSAGSNASNLGYGNINPFSNIDGKFVNIHNSHNPSIFGSNTIPGLPGISGVKNNVVAAKGIYPGSFGGAKILKKKIKNITRKYKNMNKKGKATKQIKDRVKDYMINLGPRKIAGGKLNKTKRRTTMRNKKTRNNKTRNNKRFLKTQKGGYSQYQNNLPLTHSYSVGGILGANNSALANPPPINVYKGAGQCVDNYNHYTNKGFPSLGH